MGRWRTKVVPATTNNLNTGIVGFLLHKGHSASRVNVTGVWDPDKQLFRTTGARKGFFDIVACMAPYGKYATWDTKRGRDTAKKDQLEYAAEVADAGGWASFIKTMDEFIAEYNSVEFQRFINVR